MRDLFNLDGKVAVVTGSSRGLGQGMAIALARAGADIVLTSRRIESLDESEKEIQNIGRRVLKIKLDVNVQEDIEAMVSKTTNTFGRIDILVNNAGCIIRKSALGISREEWNSVVDTILKGSFFCAQAVAKVMIQEKKGRIINIGSASCVFGTAGIMPYNAARGGMLQLTRGLAVEWGRSGITVNMLAPGWFKTDQNRALFQNRTWVGSLTERIPVGRTGIREDLDGAIVFLASDAAEYVTGQIILIDGGYTISSIKAK
jgi:gluconate 5-dehydrogenase